jgi:hypothetical protein
MAESGADEAAGYVWAGRAPGSRPLRLPLVALCLQLLEGQDPTDSKSEPRPHPPAMSAHDLQGLAELLVRFRSGLSAGERAVLDDLLYRALATLVSGGAVPEAGDLVESPAYPSSTESKAQATD